MKKRKKEKRIENQQLIIWAVYGWAAPRPEERRGENEASKLEKGC